jgi:hypothetical protein
MNPGPQNFDKSLVKNYRSFSAGNNYEDDYLGDRTGNSSVSGKFVDGNDEDLNIQNVISESSLNYAFRQKVDLTHVEEQVKFLNDNRDPDSDLEFLTNSRDTTPSKLTSIIYPPIISNFSKISNEIIIPERPVSQRISLDLLSKEINAEYSKTYKKIILLYLSLLKERFIEDKLIKFKAGNIDPGYLLIDKHDRKDTVDRNLIYTTPISSLAITVFEQSSDKTGYRQGIDWNKSIQYNLLDILPGEYDLNMSEYFMNGVWATCVRIEQRSECRCVLF